MRHATKTTARALQAGDTIVARGTRYLELAAPRTVATVRPYKKGMLMLTFEDSGPPMYVGHAMTVYLAA